jgi:hypothetical protein
MLVGLLHLYWEIFSRAIWYVYVIWMWIDWYWKYQPAEPEYEVWWRMSEAKESQTSYSVEQADIFQYQLFTFRWHVYVWFKDDKHVIWMWIWLILKNISLLDRIWSLWLFRLAHSPTNFIFYLAFQSFDFERTWWRLFQKCVGHTKFNIYVFITNLWIKIINISNKPCQCPREDDTLWD